MCNTYLSKNPIMNTNHYLSVLLKKIIASPVAIITVVLFTIPFVTNAQIATTISGGSSAAGSYGTFASAITALNGSVITGPVIVDASATQTETLTGKITLTATG